MNNIEEKCGQCHYFNSKDGICRNKQMQDVLETMYHCQTNLT